MPSNEFKNAIRQMKNAWEKARETASTPQFERLPDGRYHVSLIDAFTGVSQNGRPQITWVYLIIEGEHTGKQVREYQGLDREESLIYVARRLQFFGYSPHHIELEDLDDVLKDIVNNKSQHLQIQLKTKGEYQNVYVTKALAGPWLSDFVYGAPSDESEEPEPEKSVETNDDTIIKVNDRVEYTFAGNTYTGTVVLIDDDNDVTIHQDGTFVAHTVPAEHITRKL